MSISGVAFIIKIDVNGFNIQVSRNRILIMALKTSLHK